MADSGVITYDRANALQKAMRRIAATAPGSWLLARTLHHIDNPIAKITRGRHTLSTTSGLPIVSLTTTGAKSGLPRTVPLQDRCVAANRKSAMPALRGIQRSGSAERARSFQRGEQAGSA